MRISDWSSDVCSSDLLRYERWTLDTLREWQWQPSDYNVADAFSLLLNTPCADEATRLRTVSKRLAQVPAYYAAAEQAISHPTRIHVQLAIEQNQGALDVFGAGLEKQVDRKSTRMNSSLQ